MGGAIFGQSGTKLSLNTVTFRANTALEGGALHAVGGIWIIRYKNISFNNTIVDRKTIQQQIQPIQFHIGFLIFLLIFSLFRSLSIYLFIQIPIPLSISLSLSRSAKER